MKSQQNWNGLPDKELSSNTYSNVVASGWDSGPGDSRFLDSNSKIWNKDSHRSKRQQGNHIQSQAIEQVRTHHKGAAGHKSEDAQEPWLLSGDSFLK